MTYLVAKLLSQKLKELSSQQLFEIKQKFLMDIPHPKLIQKHLTSLSKQPDLKIDSSNLGIDKTASLLDYLKSYLDELMPLKLNIANANTRSELRNCLKNLLVIQSNLIQKVASYYPAEAKIESDKIKQSEPFNVYNYIKELEKEQIEENQIKSYLCLQFEASESDKLSEFGKAVVRAKKIDEHGG